LEDLDVDERAILKLIIKKQGVRIIYGSRQILMTGVSDRVMDLQLL
jgi:hypothetical protein